tara:strand:- start:41 stop:400 length:360 start_codon:yes stop_codon:yes gene_type:complete
LQKRYGAYKIRTLKQLLSCEGCVLGFELDNKMQIVFNSFAFNTNNRAYFIPTKDSLKKYLRNDITVLGLIQSSKEIYLGEKLITNIDDGGLHSLHKKLKDTPQDIVKENLDLLKEIIKI